MIRKLLKRECITGCTKKLKTVHRQRTALGHWAWRRFALKQNTGFSIFFPHGTALKQTRNLGKLSGHHTAVQPSANGKVYTIPITKATLKDCATPSIFSQSTWRMEKGKPLCTPLSNALSRVQPTARNENLSTGRPNQKATSSYPWTKHSLRCISKEGTPFTIQKRIYNHWKSLYSLDQLASHQFDTVYRLRVSAHKTKLMEMRKMSSLYGNLSKKHYDRLFSATSTGPGQVHTIAQLLERRLDTTLRRCFAFTTPSAAHHWIGQGKILVNNKPVTSAHYHLQPGDCVSIAKGCRSELQNGVQKLLDSRPREKRFCCTNRLLARWKEWAALHGRLKHHYPLTLNFSPASLPPVAFTRGGSQEGTPAAPSTFPSGGKKNRASHGPWPDRAIQRYWYGTGRLLASTLGKIAAYNPLAFAEYRLCGQRVIKWLATHPWPRRHRAGLASQRRFPRYKFYFNNWRAVYRRRIFVFSQWLLEQKILFSDGLYNCRWHKAFLRKKSIQQKKAYKSITVRKALHFEVSYKKQCAIFLYPPQKLTWPMMIDLRKLHS